MEIKDKLKEIDITNCTCYSFDDMTRVWDRYIDFSDYFIRQKII